MKKIEKKILIIDQSKLLRNYLKEKLENLGFDVILAKDGVDGLIKMRNQTPNLIIMEFYLPRLGGVDFLKEKQELKGTADIPIIMLSSKIDRRSILKTGKYKIFKFLSKPIEIDLLFQAIGNLFNIKFDIDQSPCIIDIHLNDDILFIEVAKGLNKEKIELMKYKIFEIEELYDFRIQKILMIITDIELRYDLYEMLSLFMENIINSTNALVASINVLTNSDYVRNFFSKHAKYKFIKITDDFLKAIESFGKIDIFAYGEEIDNIQKDLISATKLDKEDVGLIKLKFSKEKIKITKDSFNNIEKEIIIAVIDDDLSILEYMETVLSQANWNIRVYEDGNLFIEDFKTIKPDLIFLDLLMPKMSGFEVLEYLLEDKDNIPVIILTALADKNSIIKARSYGATSYLTKPVKPELIIHKAEEILKSNF